jgi:hypothetical protein
MFDEERLHQCKFILTWQCYAIFGTGAEHLIADPNSDTGEWRAHVNAACDFFRKRNPTLRWLGRHQPCASSPAATTRALPTAVAPLPPCRTIEPRRPRHRIKASPPGQFALGIDRHAFVTAPPDPGW